MKSGVTLAHGAPSLRTPFTMTPLENLLRPIPINDFWSKPPEKTQIFTDMAPPPIEIG